MDTLKRVVTPEMAKEIRAHYLAQGLTADDLLASDEGTVIPEPQRPGTIWRRWISGNGFRADCPVCKRGMVAPDRTSRHAMRGIRFQHCGRTEKLPFSFYEPWATLLKIAAFPVVLFLNRFAPRPAPAPRVFEV